MISPHARGGIAKLDKTKTLLVFGHLQCYREYRLSTSKCLSTHTGDTHTYIDMCKGFSSGSDGKESTCSAGDLSLAPGLGTSPGERNGYLLQYSCLENSMDRSL